MTERLAVGPLASSEAFIDHHLPHAVVGVWIGALLGPLRLRVGHGANDALPGSLEPNARLRSVLNHRHVGHTRCLDALLIGLMPLECSGDSLTLMASPSIAHFTFSQV